MFFVFEKLSQQLRQHNYKDHADKNQYIMKSPSLF